MLVAINENIIDKASHEALSENNGTYQNVNITPEQFAQHIKSGHAFCAQHKDGWRASKNFTASGVLAVDIDRGLSVQDALNDEYVQSHACILYTTPSHTEEFPRFRIVFELEAPIMDAGRMRSAQTGLISRFGGDSACKDACHMFYGSTTSTPILFGKKLPNQKVDELIARAEESKKAHWFSGEGEARRNIRSVSVLPKDVMVRLESGVKQLLADIPVRTRIYCPRHVDRKASAFTLRSREGNPGLYCSKCITTYFLDSKEPAYEYEFDYSWDRILKLAPEEYLWAEDESKVPTIDEIRGGHIRQLNSRYLQFDEGLVMTGDKYMVPDVVGDVSEMRKANPDWGKFIPQYRATFVKSPKGTGKTEWLASLVRAHRGRNVSILLVGHRRSLIAASAKRLGLACYLRERPINGNNSYGDEYNPPEKYYAVCVDSLATRLKPKDNHYDLILIDEVEQVFSHLLADTMKDNRRKVLHALKYYLNKAKAVYLLDADLNRTTVQIIDAMLEGETEWQAIVNLWVPDNRTVHLYKNKNHLLGELDASIRRGERCFVCSNSKKKLGEMLKALEQEFGDQKRFLIITSDNAHTVDIQGVIKNIKTAVLEYDAVLVSPAMGTGIDITFDSDGQLIDTVFGFFEARINTHFDIDQQLARVRNPKRVCVWISPETFNFETDANAIQAELEMSDAEYRIFLEFDKDGNETGSEDKLYGTVFSSVTAMQRASKNKLLKNFRDLKVHDGWTIVDVGPVSELERTGKTMHAFGKAASSEQRLKGLVSARPISPIRYDALKEQGKSDVEGSPEYYEMRRYELEMFYRKPISLELIVLDNDGKLRRCVREFELLRLPAKKLLDEAKYDRGMLTNDRRNTAQKKALYIKLLTAAGLLRADTQFDTGKEIRKDTLGDFIKVCRQKRDSIDRLLEIPVRKNLGPNPAQQLGAILGKLGLSLIQTNSTVVNGKKLYSYQLDKEDLAMIQNIFDLRADEAHKSSWETVLHDREKDGEDID